MMITREDYEAWTVPQLRIELEGRTLDVSGNKPDLVNRLLTDDVARADQASGLAPEVEVNEPEGEPERVREQRMIEAGGHQVMVDVDPPTPEPVVSCSVCGSDHCVHMQDDTGRPWATIETPPEREASPDTTFYPDETVGPRSAETRED